MKGASPLAELKKALRDDHELRDRAAAFLASAVAASKRPESELKAAVRSMHFRLEDGVEFVQSKELREAERQFVIRAVKLMGGRFGNEKDISSAAWSFVADRLKAGSDCSADAAELVGTLTTHTIESVECVLPNRLIRVPGKFDFLDIGPVRIASAQHAVDRLNSKAPRNMVFVRGSESGTTVEEDDKGVRVAVAPLCWIVAVQAARGNIEEEALWLIDVAASLLRLVHRDVTDLYPRFGEQEPHPTRDEPQFFERTFMLEDGVSVGGTSLLAAYTITEDVKLWLDEPRVATWLDQLFDPEKKTVAEQVQAGLGWLSRGRQAKGRAERLLYFFTALEALLTAPSKDEPVVQTVARNTAVILSDDNSHRVVIAKDIRRLYGRRSALVHAGRRDVSRGSATSIQMFAEGVFRRVLENVDPGKPFAEFHRELAEATYGLSWPSRLQTKTE